EGALADLIEELGRLPGIGPKGAQRIAFHVLSADAVAFGPRDAHPTEAGDRFADAGSGADSGVVWRPLAGAPLAWRHSVAWPKGRRGAAVSAFTEAATQALRTTADATADVVSRPLHLRPASEYWL
ncbi:MAG: hypothetical protein LBV60_04660, partial [Streptomyces sp.]|nr:hypothetical protein [Streptomyces sp.]